MIKSDSFQGHRIVQYMQINQCDTLYEQKERQNPYGHFISVGETLDEIQHPFMIKTLIKVY